MPNPVVHWEILTTNDAKRLQDFYADLFDWQIDANNPWNYGMVNTDSKGGINGGIGPNPEGGLVTIYVQVADLQAALDKAETLGGRVVMPPTEIPNVVTMAMFSDPDGNVIGLVNG